MLLFVIQFKFNTCITITKYTRLHSKSERLPTCPLLINTFFMCHHVLKKNNTSILNVGGKKIVKMS